MALDDSSFEGTMLVLRCCECGDAFPTDGDSVCPSCGSANSDLASEPLL